MFFNLWGDTNYILKIITFVVLTLIISFITTKILIAFNRKNIKKIKDIKEIEKILNKIEKLDEIEKFHVLINELNLPNSYKIAGFTEVNQKSIKKAIKNKEYQKINNLIINKLKGQKKII